MTQAESVLDNSEAYAASERLFVSNSVGSYVTLNATYIAVGVALVGLFVIGLSALSNASLASFKPKRRHGKFVLDFGLDDSTDAYHPHVYNRQRRHRRGKKNPFWDFVAVIFVLKFPIW